MIVVNIMYLIKGLYIYLIKEIIPKEEILIKSKKNILNPRLKIKDRKTIKNITNIFLIIPA